jgi:hypothetical protein
MPIFPRHDYTADGTLGQSLRRAAEERPGFMRSLIGGLGRARFWIGIALTAAAGWFIVWAGVLA